MGKIIAVVNQKGGVGKTTTAVNLTAALHEMGVRVLLCDFDPQANATSGMGVDKRKIKYSAYDVTINETPLKDAIIHTDYGDVLPSSADLAGATVELIGETHRERVLEKALFRAKEDYDLIFIDCPPSLGLITLNALTSADSVFIPIQCEYYALEGLTQLMSTVRRVKKLYNPSIEIEGVLLTMYDGRLNLTTQVVAEVKKHFPGKVYKATIPRNVRLSEAPSYGLPVYYYDKWSKGSVAYQEVAKELLKANSGKEG